MTVGFQLHAALWSVCHLLLRNQICNKNGSEILLPTLDASTKITVGWLKCLCPGSHQKTWVIHRYLTISPFISKCLYSRTGCIFSHFFFWVYTSFLPGSCFRTGKPLVFNCISSINHLLFKISTSFSLSVDTLIVLSPSCPAGHPSDHG